MIDNRESTNFEQLVREWSRRLHDLAFRMLGNRADAEDATQEIFCRLWERIGSYDHTRPFQPWIYRVATRSLLNRIRSEERRAKREARAPLRPIAETVQDAVDRRERESLVQEGLQRVGASERALLIMHYHHGLSQEQIALVVNSTRTTIQGRLGRALESLRVTLCPSYALVTLPWIERAMQESTPIPRDDGFVSALLRIPDSAVVAAAHDPFVLGGTLMAKKYLVAAIVLATLGAGAGFGAGRGLWPNDAEQNPARPTGSVGRSDQRATLAGAPRNLGAQFPGPALPASPAGAATASGPERATGVTGEPAPPEPDEKAGRLDWSKFSKLFAANSVKMSRSMLGHEQLTPSDSAAVAAAFAEFMRVCADARERSPNPFFDELVLPDLAVALFADAGGLTPQQTRSLEGAARAAVRTYAAQVDFERAGPLELLATRARVSSDIFQAVARDLDPETRSRLQGLEPLTRFLMMGSQSVTRIGMSPGPGEESVTSQLLGEWRTVYGLDERQTERLRSLAERYQLDALDVLRHRGVDVSESDSVSVEYEAAIQYIVRLGVVAERAILADLPPEQRARARAGPATLVLLKPGSGVTKSTINLGGL